MFHRFKLPSMSIILFLKETISLTNQLFNSVGNPWKTSFLWGQNWKIPLSMTVLERAKVLPNLYYHRCFFFQNFVTAWSDVWLKAFPVCCLLSGTDLGMGLPSCGLILTFTRTMSWSALSCPEVIKREYSLRLKIKRNDLLLADTCQTQNKAQWLAACNQSLHFILSLRLY